MSATPLPEKLLTLRDPCQLLGRSLATLQWDRAAGRIPAGIRIRQAVRFDPREIQEWVEARYPDHRTWETLQGWGGRP